jgi:hypothetical protein
LSFLEGRSVVNEPEAAFDGMAMLFSENDIENVREFMDQTALGLDAGIIPLKGLDNALGSIVDKEPCLHASRGHLVQEFHPTLFGLAFGQAKGEQFPPAISMAS